MEPLVLTPPEPTIAEADFFETPAWATEALLDVYPPRKHLRILEPCAGDGAIVRTLVSRDYYVVANDIRADVADKLKPLCFYSISDYLQGRWRDFHGSIITNPPFSLAFEVAQECMRSDARYVALLLRLNFLASKTRAAWNNTHPVSRLIVLGRRPSFTGDGKTDASDYAWFVWNRDVIPDDDAEEWKYKMGYQPPLVVT